MNASPFSIFSYFGILMLFLGISCTKTSNKTEQKPKGRELELTAEVTFLKTDGSELSTLKVAVADDQFKRNQGLMDVYSMGGDEGMLFIFDEEEPLSFYMANTPLPLDIIYVNSDSVIVSIHHNTAPFNNQSLPSGAPAQFVVETNAGYCIAHDIREGMKVRF